MGVDVDIARIGGKGVKLDDTDKQAVSVYGKGTNEGDTPIKTSSDGGVFVVFNTTSTPSDGASNSCIAFKNQNDTTTYKLAVLNHVFNNSTWDRLRGNADFTILSSAVRNATTVSADQTNYNATGVTIILDVTAVPRTDTITLDIEIKDSITGKYVSILTGSAISAIGTYVYQVGRGIADGQSKFDAIEQVALNRTWRVKITHSAGTNFTYSVGGCYIL